MEEWLQTIHFCLLRMNTTTAYYIMEQKHPNIEKGVYPSKILPSSVRYLQ